MKSRIAAMQLGSRTAKIAHGPRVHETVPGWIRQHKYLHNAKSERSCVCQRDGQRGKPLQEHSNFLVEKVLAPDANLKGSVQ